MKRVPNSPGNRILGGIRIGLFSIAIIASLVLLIHPLLRNQVYSKVLSAVLNQPANYKEAMSLLHPLIQDDCRVNWQSILLADYAKDISTIETHWKDLLNCTPEAIGWLYQVFPERSDMASYAAELYPDNALAWFWQGELARNANDYTLATQYFSETVQIDPSNSLGWCRLGLMEEYQQQEQAAFNNYVQCCLHGDPGSNGCYGAGRTAEKLNDIPAAIQYYRRSHWQPSLQRADELDATQ